nr:DUF3592 domain-containing protein [Pedobacter kyonggii]
MSNFEMICAIGISTIIMCVGLLRINERWKLNKNGIRTDGHIIHIERVIIKNKVSFVPTISYINSDSKQIEVKHSDSMPFKVYKVNEKIPIIYDVNDPENLVIVSKTTAFLDFIIAIAGFVGLLFFLQKFLM